MFPPRALPVSASGQAANDLVRLGLERDEPFMAARLGRNELNAILHAWDRKVREGSPFKYCLGRLRGTYGPTDWDQRICYSMAHHAGFFPAEPSSLDRFVERMLGDLSEVDVLGSWLPGESRLQPCFPQAAIVPLSDLEPYYHQHPWTGALAHRTVLVVHPFAESISGQYERRDRLFANPEVLPSFRLKTLKAVQSSRGEISGFADWFDALDSMQERIAGIEFDTAIVGAGAYGLPLAAFIKRLGRQAVHLGGPTQILFGIRGRRWDVRPFYAELMNEYWVRPLAEETPQIGLTTADGGYW